MQLLITGAAGFIGSNFARYWLATHPGDRVIALDALTYAGNRASLPDDSEAFRFLHGDITDAAALDRIFVEEKIDSVIHFAAESHVDRSISGPEAFLNTNVIGTFRLLDAAKKAWASRRDDGTRRRFHHVSTDEVYGTLSAEDPAFRETTPYAPNSPYAASKAASDHMVRAWHHTYGLDVVTTNCSNNYGPCHFPEKLIPLIILNLLSGKPLPVYGDGSNVRDWLYVEDHCRGIELAFEKGRAGETYNIGGNNERPNIDIVHALCDLTTQFFAEDVTLRERFPDCPAAKDLDPRSLIRFVKDRPGHDWRYAIDASKARASLGYEPQETLESGLEKTFRWYLDNEPWWRAVIDGSYQTWIESNYGSR